MTEVDITTEEVLVLQFSLFTPKKQEIRLALNTHKIREVLEWRPLTPVPDSMSPIIGILDLRGIPVPVMDLSLTVIRQATDVSAERSRIIITESMDRFLGILVPRVSKITGVLNHQIVPAPLEITKLGDGIVNAMFVHEGHFVCFLDIETVLLSLAPEPGPGPTPVNHASDAGTGHFSGKSVLIVEDSRLYQKKSCQIFESLGFRAALAENGKEGLEMLRASDATFDLIFTDIEMPLMNGIEMAKQIKAQPAFRQIPIIFSSSISNTSLIEEIKSTGLGDYVVKFEEHQIVRLVNEVFKIQPG